MFLRKMFKQEAEVQPIKEIDLPGLNKEEREEYEKLLASYYSDKGVDEPGYSVLMRYWERIKIKHADEG